MVDAKKTERTQTETPDVTHFHGIHISEVSQVPLPSTAAQQVRSITAEPLQRVNAPVSHDQTHHI